jgi:hypothetical protein
LRGLFARASQDVDGRPASAMTMQQSRGFIQGRVGQEAGAELAMTGGPTLSTFRPIALANTTTVLDILRNGV